MSFSAADLGLDRAYTVYLSISGRLYHMVVVMSIRKAERKKYRG